MAFKIVIFTNKYQFTQRISLISKIKISSGFLENKIVQPKNFLNNLSLKLKTDVIARVF